MMMMTLTLNCEVRAGAAGSAVKVLGQQDCPELAAADTTQPQPRLRLPPRQDATEALQHRDNDW
jgi:hypothetical protein